MTAFLLAVALLSPQSSHPCDLPPQATFTVKPETVLMLSWCQGVKVLDANGVMVPARDDGFTLNWNGNLLDLKVGTTPAPEVAAPVGDPSLTGWQEYRTPIFLGGGIHTITITAWSLAADGTRIALAPSSRITIEATANNLPVDCVVSGWVCSSGEWSACSVDGTQTRQLTCSRTIITEPLNGGQACPALTETRTESQSCEPPPPQDDCQIRPFVVDRVAWPSDNSGRRSVTFRTVEDWASFAFAWPGTLTVTAARGCVTVVRR